MEPLQKPAETSLALHPIVKNRWSPRSFSSTPVESDKLRRVLEAARWAPSAFNEQPWRFVVGVKADNPYSRLMESLVEWNRNWASTVPVLLAVFGKKTLTKNGEPNATYGYDTGQAVAWLTMQALHEGLAVHQMGGFDKEYIANIFSVPSDFEPITVIALGYQASPDELPEEYKKAELAKRNRKSLSELVFSEKFGIAREL